MGRFYPWADKSYDAASVYEWLGLMKSASFVFTDSFHGLCFSIKNHKQFIIVSRPDKKDKNQDLMDKAGIKRGFYEGKEAIEDYLMPDIDYKEVHYNILKYKNASIEYLSDCLEKARRT